MISVVFIGTSSFTLPALEALNNDPRFRILAVITQPAKPAGRKHKITTSPVEEKAKKLNLKVWTPEKIDDCAIDLASLSPDCLVVASYGQIIPKNILDIPHSGAFNIHPSLLPKYRGPSPAPATLLNGETEAGVSIMLMDEEMDHGPILAQKKIKINETITAPELLNILAAEGAKILNDVIIKFNQVEIKPIPQNHKQATFSKLLKREDGRIDFNKPTTQIFNQYRGLAPWPGIFAMKDNQPIKFIKMIKGENKNNLIPGALFSENEKLFLKTKDGALQILELQPGGSKSMSAEQFINGYSKKLPLELS